METIKITKDSTMAEILENYPSAQRALFTRYHVGGCSSCGFQPSDSLEAVCKSHNILDVNEVIQHIVQSEDLDNKIQVSAKDAARHLKDDKRVKLLDVRDEQEYRMAHIEGSLLVTQDNLQQVMEWPKNTPILVHCHHGIRSMDAASYLVGHGFTDVRSIRGGIEAWSQDVDPSVPRY